MPEDGCLRSFCKAANLDFAALTVNPFGGFGPKLLEVYDAMMDYRKLEAKQTGYPLKKLEGKERRALEKISASMCRNLHRALLYNTHGRASSTALPTADSEDEGDAHQSET